MLHSLLDNLFGVVKYSSEPKQESIEILSAKQNPASNPTSPVYDDPEIEILARVFGPMTEGMVIEVSLQDILRILPRSRRRADAYNGLKKRLEALGVQLRVASRVNNHKNEQDKGEER